MALPLLALAGFGLGFASDAMAERNQRKQFNSIMGRPAEELTGPAQGGGPLMSPGTGLMGGEISRPQAAAQMMQLGGPYEQVGANVLQSYMTPQEPQKSTSGMQNYQFLLNMGKTPEEAAEMAFKTGTNVTTNVGTEGAMQAPPLVSDEERRARNWPEGTAINAKTGSPIFPPAASAKKTAQMEQANAIVDQYDNLLFGEGGIYSDYGAWSEDLGLPEDGWIGNLTEKLGQTARSNMELFLQNDPRFKTYNNFVEGSIAPLVKSLGESGNLATEDVDRGLGLAAQITGVNIDSPETARDKMTQLKQLIGQAKQDAENKLTYPDAPPIGEKKYYDGKQYRFNGGNPKSKESWEVVK